MPTQHATEQQNESRNQTFQDNTAVLDNPVFDELGSEQGLPVSGEQKVLSANQTSAKDSIPTVNAAGSIQMKPLESEEEKADLNSDSSIQMQVGNPDENNKQDNGQIQMKADGGGGQATPQLESKLNQTKGSGQPLPNNVASEMSSKIGADFSNVKTHTDDNAAQMNQGLGAKAFTHGKDIYFDKGEYNPDSNDGKRLLAHELTHTAQQQQSVQPKLQMKKRKEWRYFYGKGNLKGYNTHFNSAKHFGLNPKKIEKSGKITFEYDQYDKAEMIKKQKDAQKKLGSRWKIEVRKDAKFNSYRLRINPICPPGFQKVKGSTYEKCFNTEKEAKKAQDKYLDTGIKATISSTPDKVKIFGYEHQVGETMHWLKFKKLSKPQASKKGKAAAKKRPGYKEGMYKVNVTESKTLNTYQYKIETVAPKGYKYLGEYKITGYVTAHERDFAAKPTVKDPPGLKGTFRKKFLYETKVHPRGVIFQGSGKSFSGKIIQYNPATKKFYVAKCPKTATGTCAKSGRTAAVDFAKIKRGKNILIEDVGKRVAEDTGGWIKGKHIDVYYGYIGMAAARTKSMSKKKVFEKT